MEKGRGEMPHWANRSAANRVEENFRLLVVDVLSEMNELIELLAKKNGWEKAVDMVFEAWKDKSIAAYLMVEQVEKGKDAPFPDHRWMYYAFPLSELNEEGANELITTNGLDERLLEGYEDKEGDILVFSDNDYVFGQIKGNSLIPGDEEAWAEFFGKLAQEGK